MAHANVIVGFLNGYRLTIEITPDGDLTVEPLT